MTPKPRRIKDTKELPRVTRMMCEDILHNYNNYKKELKRIERERIPSATPGYSPTAGVQAGNPESRPTEEIALSIIADARYQYLTKAVDAVDLLLRTLDIDDRDLIRFVYMDRRKYCIEAAGILCNVSERQAYRVILKALTMLARILGYIPQK